MRLLSWQGFFCLLASAAFAVPASADSESTGDATLALLGTAALASTFLHDDTEGRWMLGKSAAASIAAISLVKLAFNDTNFGERPNGKGYGFPSGHAGAAAAGASFLQGRYGWTWGVPAWLAAGYVSYVRVEQTHHHRWRDIAAAAAIAQASSWYFVDSYKDTKLAFAPIIDGETVGMNLSFRF